MSITLTYNIINVIILQIKLIKCGIATAQKTMYLINWVFSDLLLLGFSLLHQKKDLFSFFFFKEGTILDTKMPLSFSFMGRILWLLTVTNRVVKSSKKPDAFTAIQNKFGHRDHGLNSITLLHSAEYQKCPSYSTVHRRPI